MLQDDKPVWLGPMIESQSLFNVVEFYLCDWSKYLIKVFISDKVMSSKKKVKVQCLECNAVFDHYYRKTHNFKQHSNLLKNKKIVRYQIHGAPKNVFEAASKKSSMPSSKASDTDIENENDEFCNTDEPEPMNTTENSEIRCEEISY